jgi:C-methyltransferase
MAAPEEPATARLMEYLYGKEKSGALVAAAQLRLADEVGDGATEIGDLARAVQADPDALLRLMRTLTLMGIFRKAGERSFAHTELSRGLRSDSPEGFHDMVLLEGAEWSWAMTRSTAEAVRTGKPVFPTLYGKDLFTYFAEDDPVAGRVFDNAMTAMNEASVPMVCELLDLTGVGTVADIGGGQGSLIRALLHQHPGTKGVLFDVEHALHDVHAELRDGALADRCTIVTGDCTVSVPIRADVYLLRHVLHMWDDNTAVQVLKNCAAAASSGTRIIVIEQLLHEDSGDPSVALLDLHMLAIGGGKTRTPDDFAGLVSRAGLTFDGVVGPPFGDQLVRAVVS